MLLRPDGFNLQKPQKKNRCGGGQSPASPTVRCRVATGILSFLAGSLEYGVQGAQSRLKMRRTGWVVVAT